MTALSQPRHPIVTGALDLASTWCAGHVIGGAPALAHAINVAHTVDRHIPDAPVELIAVALLHDAPEFAPGDIDLGAVLTRQTAPAVARTIRALERALASGETGEGKPVDPEDLWTLCVSAADRIASLSSVLRRAGRPEDAAAYWRTRTPFIAQVPHYRAFSQQSAPHLPGGMAAELEHLITRAEHATAEHR
jgi:5'-deoxynucleotidase YfbR-like HD superfamily hydrolase